MSILASDSPRRRWAIALALYAGCSLVFALVAGPERLTQHTAFNHYALLADAWLHGRLDLPGGPPAYTQNNDFGQVGGKTYITFPPFPALLMLPFVKLAGSPENFRDGQLVIWLSGAAPALLFLALEKLRQRSLSNRSEAGNIVLSLLFAFGTVYFFTAVEGTVWFAALVVGAALQAAYVLFALEAAYPLLAGLALACAYMTRPPILLTAPLFVLEAVRVCSRPGTFAAATPNEKPGFGGGAPNQKLGASSWVDRSKVVWRAIEWRPLAKKVGFFVAPTLFAFAVNSLLNHARYGTFNPFDPGHEYLTVAWRARMTKWGVLSYHYLAKNLGVMLTSLPWLAPRGYGSEAGSGAPFQINEHGVALWFTTPLYLWLLWPRRRGFLHVAVVVSALLPMAMDLLYQNTGWRQFGYRFSCDYAVLLFVLLALGDRTMGWGFRMAAVWGIGWNLFGAVTFDRAAYDRYYFREPSQAVLYQPD